jgi:hypothetical protein
MVPGGGSVESFCLKSADRQATIEFFGRLPSEAAMEIEHFMVRVTNGDLTAATSVYAHHADELARFFIEMAGAWRGWHGDVVWQSLDGEMRLTSTNDRRGHILLRIEIRSGCDDLDWSVQSGVMIEAGQLERIAGEAVGFFTPSRG